MKLLGNIVENEFKKHKIIGLNDIISWKESVDFRKTKASFEAYQNQIADRYSYYTDVDLKIDYLRGYLRTISRGLGLQDATTAERITLCKFGYGLCGEQSHFAHYILRKYCESLVINLDSKILTLCKKDSSATHAFVIYGSDLTNLTNIFSSLKSLDANVYVFDPTFKILISANEYALHPYILEFCNEYHLHNILTHSEDNKISHLTKETLVRIQDQSDLIFSRSMAGIRQSLKKYKGDPMIIKILQDFLTETSTREQLLNRYPFNACFIS